MTIESLKALQTLVTDYEVHGGERRDSALGVQNMPEGYALMLNADRTHYYWLRHDGTEGPIDWDKWRVRRNAFANSKAELKALQKRMDG